MKDTLPVRVRLGNFELDLRAGELRQGDQVIRLQEKSFRVLQILIEHSGELVTRDEIQKKLWPNDTVVDFEHGINSAIKRLRTALGDSAESPKFVETVAGRGYRFMVSVQWVGPSPIDMSASDGVANIQSGVPEKLKPEASGLTGKKVSHYRVLEVIGGGGMGLVYKAEDIKLGRQVALKFLSQEWASDPAALQRFEREARAASSLNHPNICIIFEVEEHEANPFIVMELLEGETLRNRLSRFDQTEKCLRFDQLVDVGIQICAGLQAAHDKGIIHRDIKPANIFLTKQGLVKILDFGLAKLVDRNEQAGRDGLQPEPSDPRLVLDPAGSALADATVTRLGVAMGTAGYMSPEQVRGEKLDARTDLFSFGLVVYEMATGQRAFNGETAEIVRNAILHEPQIAVRELNSTVPLKLEAIINKALEKDSLIRYQTAAAIGSDLARLHHDSESDVQKLKRDSRTLILWGAALLMVPLTLILGGRWFKTQPIASGKAPSERRVTYNPSENRLIGAAISPDGKYIAYTDTKGLHLSVIETGEIHDVLLPEELQTRLWAVGWFPDGEKLLFTASSEDGFTIWVTSVFGGTPRKLRGDSGIWAVASPQGSLIAFVSGNWHELWVMGANGENPRKVLASEKDTYGGPAWSPTGQRLAYIRAGDQPGGSIETVSLNGGLPSVVISHPKLAHEGGPNLVWAQDGRLLFLLDEVPRQNAWNLWEIATDPQTGNATAKATELTNSDWPATYSISISRDAKRLAVVKTHGRNDVYAGELKVRGTRLTSPARLTVSESDDYVSGWMHDSKTVLFQSNRTGRNQVFRQQMEQNSANPLTGGPSEEEGAELSPDGRWILYWSTETRKDKPPPARQLMRFPVSGGSPEQVLEARTDELADFDCSGQPAGTCIFDRWKGRELIFYALDPVRGLGKVVARTKLGRPTNLSVSVSPSGSRIALCSWDQLRDQVRILDLATSTERDLAVPRGWYIWSLSWTAEGDALFAAVQSTTGYLIIRIGLEGEIVVLLDRGRNNWLGHPYSSPDGRRLAFTQMTWENNVWLLENF